MEENKTSFLKSVSGMVEWSIEHTFSLWVTFYFSGDDIGFSLALSSFEQVL